MDPRKRPGWRRSGAILPLILIVAGCGQAAPARRAPDVPARNVSSGQPQMQDMERLLEDEPSESSEPMVQASTGESPSQASDGGISQSSQTNQSTSGGDGSSSVSTSSQTIDNGDGTVTIIETRQVDGHTETTRRTVRRADVNQGSSQSIEQRIEQR
jgi:hypothetical protein